MSLAQRLKDEAAKRAPVEKTQEPEVIENTQGDVDEVDELKADEVAPEEVTKRTIESYEDEVKALREENAKRRKKEQEAKAKALEQAEELFKSERELYENKMAEMQKQLEELKAVKVQEVDKSLDDAIKSKEKDAEISNILKELNELKRRNEESEKILREQREREEEEKELRSLAAKNRFKALLKEIPEEQHKYAEAMFNGFKDPQEGLLAIADAKSTGIFGKKKIEVVSTAPKVYNHKPEEEKKQTLTNRKVKLTEAIKAKRSNLAPGDRLT